MARAAEPRPARARAGAPSFATGFGLGAFLDGIVFHQVLQWHHLVVAHRPADDLAGLEHNTFWDGVFHLGAWCVVLAGVLGLARARDDLPRLGRRGFAGLLLAGWGAFHLVDQVVFHLVLGAHHIRMVEDFWVYDAVYTAVGVALVLAGGLLARPVRRSARGPGAASGRPGAAHARPERPAG